MGKTLSEMYNDIRYDLGDSASSITNDEIARAVERAIYDYSRVCPRELLYEANLQFSVSKEVVTITALDTAYSLAYKPIKWNSVTVIDNAETTTYTEDTDYYIDYANGTIECPTGGSISAGDDVKVSYTKSRVSIDLTSLTGLIRPIEVIYPVGDIPQKVVSFDYFGGLLTLGSRYDSEQSEMAESKHCLIKYHALHTVPQTSTSGSQPSYIDISIELAAAAYILFSIATKQELQCITDLASARTALGNIAAIQSSVTSALGKIDTYVAGASESTKALLAQISTDASTLRTAIATALTAANSYLDDVDTTDFSLADYGSEALISTGKSLINKVNVGDKVPDLYATYSQSVVQRATARINAALGYVQEAANRIADLKTYIDQAVAYTKISDAFATEASAELYQIDRYINEASSYLTAVSVNRDLIAGIREEAQDRRNEAWATWTNSSQLRFDNSQSPIR